MPYVWFFNGIKPATINRRWHKGSWASSAFLKITAIYLGIFRGHLEANRPFSCVCAATDQQAFTHTHSHPVKRGFTLGQYKKKRKKKCWELLFSPMLVFVLLPCMLNEVIPEKYVEILLYLRKRSVILSFGSDLLGCIHMTIYNCKTFQNLPSSQLDTTSSAETWIYTPSPLKCGINHFSWTI